MQRARPLPSTARLVEAARRAGVTDARLLGAMASVPRERFLPTRLRDRAGEDAPLPIGRGQTASQPSLQARMIEALDLRGHERVLEVGTGAGYQTALLAHVAREVFSVDVEPRFVERAATALADLPGVTVRVADGLAGLPDHAPFDAIIVSFRIHGVPGALADQLTDGGLLVAPVAVPSPDAPEGTPPSRRDGRCEVVRHRRVGGRLVRERVLCPAWFVEARSLPG